LKSFILPALDLLTASSDVEAIPEKSKYAPMIIAVLPYPA
jgi:hypothetical protein